MAEKRKGSGGGLLFVLLVAGLVLGVVAVYEPYNDRYPGFYRSFRRLTSNTGEFAWEAKAKLKGKVSEILARFESGQVDQNRGGPDKPEPDSAQARARLKEESQPKLDKLTDSDRKDLNGLIEKFE